MGYAVVEEWRLEGVEYVPYVLDAKGKLMKVAWAPQQGSVDFFLRDTTTEVLFSGTRGAGKGLHNTTKVLTDSGWKQAGDVALTDKLVSVDGTYVDILGIYPQGVKPVYEVTFADGAAITADDTHKWKVYDGHACKWSVKTTKELAALKPTRCGYHVPLIDVGVPGPKWTGYDPYTFGAEGGQKYIPQDLLNADRETRLALLQGLMDTDGHCDKDGRCQFTTISEQLAKDVCQLVWSLGGKATSRLSKRSAGGFGGRELYYRINVTHAGKFVPFRLPRHVARLKPDQHGSRRRIKSVTPCGHLPTTCFAVDHPSHLFVIQDYVVTHNSDALLMDFLQDVGVGWGAAWTGIIFRQSHPQLRDIIERSKKWIRRIWPEALYNEVKCKWEWPTGELLYFSHFQNPSQYWDYHGMAFPWIGWEELTTWASDDCFKVMFSCSRSTVKGMPRKIRSTTNPFGCVRFGEVLTRRGWVDIREFQDGDEVLSVSPRGIPRYSPAYAHSQPYTGDLITRKGRGMFMEFTADHRLPQLNTDRSWHHLERFDDLPLVEAAIRATVAEPWSGTDVDFVLPEVKHRKLRRTQPTRLTAMQYATLMGWYLSEGCLVARDRGFSIAQQKHRALLEADIAELGFQGSWSVQQFNVCNPAWYEHLKQFGASRGMHVPRILLDASEPVLQRLFDRLMIGDGHRTSGHSGRYFTTSKQLADDVAEICVKLGYRVYTGVRQRKNRRGLSYEVNFCHSKPIWLLNKTVKREHFEGEVFCLRVPGDETFFIRQNGTVWLSGNSGHNWVKTRYNLPISGEIIDGRRPTVGAVITGAVDASGNAEPDRRAIHGYLDENVLLLHADPKYKDRIKAAARSKAELEAWMHGSWDIVAGGMFDDIWYEAKSSIVMDPFDIPSTWRIYRAYDHGSSKPFSVGWYAISDGSDLRLRDGRIRATVRGDMFRVREWYGCTDVPNQGLRLLIGDISRGIVEREIQWGLRSPDNSWKRVSSGPADSSIFDDNINGSTISIADDFAKPVMIGGIKHSGIVWEKADKSPGSRQQGWEQIRKRLKATMRPEGGYREIPGLFITTDCPHWLRCVPVLPRDEIKYDDVSTDSEDHNGDETRYMLRFEIKTLKTGRTT